MSLANNRPQINYLKLIKAEKFPPGICVKSLSVFELWADNKVLN